MKNFLYAVTALTLLVSAFSCFADGSTGSFTVKSVWVENGIAYVITPTVSTANPDNCTKSDKLFVLSSNPGYKQIVATVMLAKVTNASMIAWTAGCQSFWGGNTWPIVYAIGTESP